MKLVRISRKTINLLFALILELFAREGMGEERFDFVWEGRLTKDTGVPIEGPVSLSIAFFHGPMDAEPVLIVTDGLGHVPLLDGIFQIKLSLTAAQYGAIFPRTSQAVYVQVTNRSDPQSLPFPRQQISMMPYAARIPIDENTLKFDENGKLTVESVPMALVSGLSAALATKTTRSEVQELISTSMTNPHTHLAQDITGLMAILDSKASIDQEVRGDVTGTLTGTVVSGLRGMALPSPTATDTGKFIQFTGSGFAYAKSNPGTVVNVSGEDPIYVTNPTSAPRIAMRMSSPTQGGYLRSEDFKYFSAKQDAITPATNITAGSITTSLVDGVTLLPYGSAAGQTSVLSFQSTNGKNLGFKAPDNVVSSLTWVLPDRDGTNGQVLVTDGNGNLGWNTSLPAIYPAGTYTKVTTNERGLVVSGTTLQPSDIPDLDASKISTGHMVLPGDPVDPLQAASKSYVDDVKNRVPADARASFSATAPIKYNSGTGLISLEGLTELGQANQIVGMNSDGSQLEYKSLTGTAKQVNITHSAGGINFSIPQDISESSSPVFQGITLSGLGAGVVHSSSNGTLSSSAVLLDSGDVSGILPVDKGGTGISTVPALGEILAGDGNGGYVPTALGSGAYGGITINKTAGSIILDTVQDLRTTSTPTFAGITLSGPGVTTPTITVQNIKGKSESGPDMQGRSLQLSAGQGRGTGASGSIIFQTGEGGGESGSALAPVYTRMIVTPSGNVGIGTSTPNARLDVATDKDNVIGLVVRANSENQSVDLMQWRDSQGSVLGKVDKSGYVFLPGDPTESLQAATKQYVDNFISSTNSVLDNLTTSDVAEGSRLYFTTERARASVSATAPLEYSSDTGVVALKGLQDFGQGNQIMGITAAGGSLEYKSLSGTPNRVTVTHSAGGITLGTPQDIATSSTPSFSNLKLTSPAMGVMKLGPGGEIATSKVDLTKVDASEEVTGVLPISKGGTGQYRIPVAGEILIGTSAGGFVPATLGIGPNDSVTVTNASGNITLDTIQDIRTTASPEFAGLTAGIGGVITPFVSTQAIRGKDATGNDTAGGLLQISAGQGTGTGSSGAVEFRTGEAGLASGSTLNPVATRMTITAAGNIGIATDAPNARLQVDTGDPSISGLIIKATDASQAADLTQWQDAAGQVLSRVDRNGYVFLPGAPTADLHAVSKKYVDDSISAANNSITNLTTTDVREGTNLYYTNDRARNAIEVTAPLIYSSTSGVMGLKGLSTFGTSNQIIGVTAAGGNLEYKDVQGTDDQVLVSHTAGSIKIGTAQNIATTSSPTFANLTLTQPTAGVMKLGLGGNVSTSKVDLGLVGLTEEVTGTLPIAKGGTGTNTAPTSGRFLIGNDVGGYSIGQIVAGNGISVANGSGTITISTTQGLSESDSPSFLGLHVGAGGLDSTTRISTPLVVLGGGDASESPTSGTLRGVSATGTDIAGASVTIAAGNGTGMGGSGDIDFATAPPFDTSSSVENNFVTRLKINRYGLVGIGTSQPSGTLSIKALTNTTPALVVSGASPSQSAALTQWTTSAGTVKSYVDKDGYFYQPADPSENRQVATKRYVDTLVGAASAEVIQYQGADLASGGQVNEFWRGDKTWAVVTSNLVEEDPANLFFTQERARAILSARAPLAYNSTTGAISLMGVSSNGTANQILGMNTTGSGLEFKTVTGTENQVIVDADSTPGTFKFSLPQDMSSSSSPTFAGLTLSSLAGAEGIVHNDSAGNLTSSLLDLNLDSAPGALSVTKGGTGQMMSPTVGQILIGTSMGGFVPASIQEGPNRGVVVTNGSGSITLDTVQDIRTTASPVFTGITATSGITSPVVTASTLRASPGEGANTVGSDLKVEAGKGTGTGDSGKIEFRTGKGGATSSSDPNAVSTRMVITPGGNVGIATESPAGRLHVTSGANDVPSLVVSATSGGQTAALTEWRDDSGNVLSKVDKNGYFILPGDPTVDLQAATKAYVDAKVSATSNEISSLTTSDVPEGTNLYFTNQRARNALSALAPLDYSSLSGVMRLNGLSTLGSINQLMGMNAAGTGLEYKTLTGSANILITQSAGSVSLSTPQGIATSDSPMFAGMSLSGLSTGIVKADATGSFSSSPVNLATADVTGVLPVTSGGTGSSAVPTNGQLLIGNGSTGKFVAANLSVGPSLVAGNGAGSLSIDVVQDIRTTAVPVFSGIIANSSGVSTPFVTTPLVRPAAASGSNQNGTNLQIEAGKGTGTGTSGSIEFRTAPAGSTDGTVVNNVTTQMTITASGNVGIGTTTPTGRLHVVTGGDAVPGVVVKPSTSNQTADLMQWTNSGGTRLSWIDSSGNLWLPGNPTSNLQASTKKYIDDLTTNLNTRIDNLTTTNVPEGTRLYFTTPRARAAITASAPLDYSTTTGNLALKGLSTLGTANQILGMNSGATGLEYKTLSVSTNLLLTNTAGEISLDTAQGIKTTDSPTFAGLRISNLTTGVMKSASDGTVSASAVGLATADVSGVLPIAKGGTGVSEPPTDGQLLIGATQTAGYTRANLTAGNSISITNGSGSITLNTVQDLRTTARPTFDGLNVGVSGITSPTLVVGTGDGTADATGGKLRAANIAGTNVIGKDLILEAGMGTGSQGSGSILFRTASSGGAAGTAQNTPVARMAIGSSGRVGIGTTNPSSLLEVYGPGTVESKITSTSSTARLTTNGTAGGSIANLTGDFNITNSATTGAIRINTNNVERFRITSEGNVGIGTTGPTARQHISTGGDANVGLKVQSSTINQTADLTQWLNSDGTVLSQIDKNGFLILPSAAPTVAGQAATKGYVDGEKAKIDASIATKESTITAGTSTQYWRGDKTWRTLNSDVVTEGTSNKYYTDARARSAISVNAPLAYSSSTGVISLSSSGVAAGTYHRSTVTVDQFGHITSASSGPTIGSADITDGTIADVDISPTAAIADTKLATITSAGKVANSATTAVSTNTANRIVLRDALGNFAAGTITATLNGTATNVSGLVAVANGGMGANLAATGGPGQYLKQSTLGGAISVGTIASSDVPWGTPQDIGSGTPSTGTFTNVTVNGNLGIGTASPTHKLWVSGGYSILNDANSTTNANYGAMLYTDRGFGLDLGHSNAGFWASRLYTRGSDGDIVFSKTNTSGSPTLQSHFTDLVTIKNNGNVGIGTTSPSGLLDVNGKMRVTSDGTIQSPGTAGTFLGMIETNYGAGDRYGLGQFANGQLALYASDVHASSSISFGRLTSTPSFVNLMHIKKDGNVGIGTISPMAKLEVNGNIALPLGSAITVAPSTSWPSGTHNLIRPYTSGVDNAVDLYTPGSQRAAPVLTLVSTGNVGIGTTTASHVLTLAGSGNVLGIDNGAIFAAKNSSGAYENFLWPRASDNATYLNYGSAGLSIRNNANTPAMFLTSAGNIGIGTTNPTAKVQVTGGQVVGAYYDAGSSGTIDWNNGNVQKSSVSASTLSIVQASMIEGGIYTLVLTNTSGGNYSFSSTGTTFKCNPACPVVVSQGKETLISIIKIGSIAFVSWQGDFQ